MASTLTKTAAQKIITKLINGEDYRIEIVTLINTEFLDYVINFFKRIVDAKLRNESITLEWYKEEFLRDDLPSSEIAINSGLNIKTISNMYNTANREIVIKASKEHYEQLYTAIQSLINEQNEIDVTLTLRLNKVSVDLNVSESLIVINTLAVKRAALRGGLWSTAGKRVERPLMLTLCKLFGVSDDNYKSKHGSKASRKNNFEREVDFYLSTQEKLYKCEVKLMGKGNPESADAVIARDSKVLIADKLSNTNKNQLDSLGIEWVEMRTHNGYRRFMEVLENLGIPHKDFTGNINERLKEIFLDIF